MNKRILAIFGSGGQGKEVRELADLDNKVTNKWDEIIFVDDVQPEGRVMDTPRMHMEHAISKYTNDYLEFCVALGEPSSKKKVFDLLEKQGYKFANVISPEATISPYAVLGVGLIIKKAALISPEAIIGNNTTLQAFVAVGHGAVIGKHCQIATHSVIGGETVVGDCVYIGLNCPVKEKVILGSNSVVSAGAAVLRDIPENVIVMGNPARIIAKKNENEKIFKERVGN